MHDQSHGSTNATWHGNRNDQPILFSNFSCNQLVFGLKIEHLGYLTMYYALFNFKNLKRLLNHQRHTIE